MALIIEYSQVLERIAALGLKSVYFNSGAFGFVGDAPVKVVGWLGPDDPTIRAGLAADLMRVPAPYPENLTHRLLRFWPRNIDGPAWLMPKSHWSYELDHGNKSWLPGALREAGIDPELLQSRPNASAIEFDESETAGLRNFILRLLQSLVGSDFAIIFPRHPHVVTIHHHQQLWWQTRDEAVAHRLASNP